MQNRSLLWFLFLASLFLVGCGEDKFPRANVTGLVTLNGEPLAGATIGFEPRAKEGLDAGLAGYGTTDAEGRYQLAAPDGSKGAVIGENLVWIRTLRAEEGENGGVNIVSPERLPARYHEKTELSWQVPTKGTDTAHFVLTSP